MKPIEDRIDWWQITEDLRKAGVQVDDQAKQVGASRTAVKSWRNHDTEPRYLHGARLLDLWRRHCVKKAPTKPARAMHTLINR